MTEQAVYVLEKMAHGFKRLGRAHGAGFYDYEDGDMTLWSGLSTFRRSARKFAAEDVADRLLHVVVVEALRAVESGLVRSARDADAASLLALGFPAWAGGVANYVDHVGAQAVLDRCRELAARFGERFAPPALLERHAREGGAL